MRSLLQYEGFAEIRDESLRSALEPVTPIDATVAVIDWHCNFVSVDEASDFAADNNMLDGLYAITRDNADQPALQWLEEAHRPRGTLPNELLDHPVASRTSASAHRIHVGTFRHGDEAHVPPRPDLDELTTIKHLLVKALQPSFNRPIEGNALQQRIILRNLYFDSEGAIFFPEASCQPGLVDFVPPSDQHPDGLITQYWIGENGYFTKDPISAPAFSQKRKNATHAGIPHLRTPRRQEQYRVSHGGWTGTVAALALLAALGTIGYLGDRNPALLERGLRDAADAAQATFGSIQKFVASASEDILGSVEDIQVSVNTADTEPDLALGPSEDAAPSAKSDSMDENGDQAANEIEELPVSHRSGSDQLTEDDYSDDPVLDSSHLAEAKSAADDADQQVAQTDVLTSPLAIEDVAAEADQVIEENTAPTELAAQALDAEPEQVLSEDEPKLNAEQVQDSVQYASLDASDGGIGNSDSNESGEGCWTMSGTLTCVVEMDGSFHLVPLGKPIRPCGSLSARSCRTDLEVIAMR